jgi:hypothetical protein
LELARKINATSILPSGKYQVGFPTQQILVDRLIGLSILELINIQHVFDFPAKEVIFNFFNITNIRLLIKLVISKSLFIKI